MIKSAPAKLVLFLIFEFTACSVVVNADRSRVKDDLYQPSHTSPDASTDDAGDGSPDAGDGESMAGASGAAGATGTPGAGASGAAGATGEGGAAGAG